MFYRPPQQSWDFHLYFAELLEKKLDYKLDIRFTFILLTVPPLPIVTEKVDSPFKLIFSETKKPLEPPAYPPPPPPPPPI